MLVGDRGLLRTFKKFKIKILETPEIRLPSRAIYFDYLFNHLHNFVHVHFFGLSQHGLLVQFEYVTTRLAQLDHHTIGLYPAYELGDFSIALDAEVSRANEIDFAVERRV
jgi:hypothetical protein